MRNIIFLLIVFFLAVFGFNLKEKLIEPMCKFKKKADDNSKTYQEFLDDAKRSTEVSIEEVKKYAQESLDNDGTFEELYAQIDELVKKYTG